MIRLKLLPSFYPAFSMILIGSIGILLADPQPGGEAPAIDPQDSKPSSEAKRTVNELIEHLGSKSRIEREVAEAELLERGPEILGEFPAPETLSNPQIRTSLIRIRRELEFRQAKKSLEPSRLTIQHDGSQEGLAELIRKQTGNKLRFPENSENLRVNWNEVPFWLAMEQLSQTEGWKTAGVPGLEAGILAFQACAEEDRSMAHDLRGAWRIGLETAAYDPEKKRCRFKLEVSCEPRLRPLFLQYLAEKQTLSVNGHPCPTANPGGSYDLPALEGGRRIPILLDFSVPVEPGVESEWKIAGKLSIETAAGTAQLVFREATRSLGLSRRHGGVTARVTKVQLVPEDLLKIRILVKYDTGGPAFESHRTWLLHNGAYLKLENGKLVPPEADFETILQRDGAIALEYSFKAPPEGFPASTSFVYEAPTLITTVELPYQLTGWRPR